MRLVRRTETLECHYGVAGRGNRGYHAGPYCSAVEMHGASAALAQAATEARPVQAEIIA
jgi:hypothetical protein